MLMNLWPKFNDEISALEGLDGTYLDIMMSYIINIV